MSKRHFSALVVAVVLVVIAIALLVPEPTGRDHTAGSNLIFPGLQERVNRIDRVAIVAGGGRAVATLQRGDQAWTVNELAGYQADWETVRGLLAGLAQARVIEIKTENPDYYDRLGVEDVAADGAGGLLVTLRADDGDLGVIVGKQAEGRDGRYLRSVDSARSLLSDFDAQVPDEASGWVEREVSDIASADVAEVIIEHPDGDRVHVLKTQADAADFSLENLPVGRELQSSWSVNSLGGILSALQLDSVGTGDAVDWSRATRIELRTFSGMTVSVDAVLQGEEHWIRLSAAGEPQQPQTESSTASEVEANAAQGDQPGQVEEKDGDTLSEEVSVFNARVSGWAYRIPAYKFEAMTKRLEDLLKSPEESTD